MNRHLLGRNNVLQFTTERTVALTGRKVSSEATVVKSNLVSVKLPSSGQKISLHVAVS